MLHRQKFDAFGNSNNPTWLSSNPAVRRVRRGYTGHEHDPETGLVNMGARLYDSVTARFMTPDPVLQVPGYTQSHNRFSYAWNSPFKWVDPFGTDNKPKVENLPPMDIVASPTKLDPNDDGDLNLRLPPADFVPPPMPRKVDALRESAMEEFFPGPRMEDTPEGQAIQAILDAAVQDPQCELASCYAESQFLLDVAKHQEAQRVEEELSRLNSLRIMKEENPHGHSTEDVSTLDLAGLGLGKLAVGAVGAGTRMGLGLAEGPGRVGYRAWAASRGLRTWDEIAPRMYAGDAARVRSAMQSANELHFNMEGFFPPKVPQLELRFGQPIQSYTNFEYSLMRTQYADKSFFWLGDQPYTGPHPF